MVLCFSLDERLHISWLTWWQILTWKTRILHVDASTIRTREKGFPGDPGVKSPPANAGDVSLVPGPGRSCLHRSTEARVPQLSPSILDLLPSTGEAAPVRSPCTTPGNNPAPRSWRKTPRSKQDPVPPKINQQSEDHDGLLCGFLVTSRCLAFEVESGLGWSGAGRGTPQGAE